MILYCILDTGCRPCRPGSWRLSSESEKSNCRISMVHRPV